MDMPADVKQRNPSLLGLLLPDKARVDAQRHSRFDAGEAISGRINKHDFFNLATRTFFPPLLTGVAAGRGTDCPQR